MTRTKQTGENRRREVVRARVSLAEKKRLEEKAAEADLSISDWIRSKTIDAKPLLRKPSPDRELMLRFLAAFGKAASNLNQMARQLNRKQDSEETEVPVKMIVYVLEDIKEITRQIREVFSHGGERKNQG